jgi:hypothetical protein
VSLAEFYRREFGNERTWKWWFGVLGISLDGLLCRDQHLTPMRESILAPPSDTSQTKADATGKFA